MLKTRPCRDCGTDVVWVLTQSGHWRLFSPRPVRFDDAAPGIVLHRRRGWVDAGTVWPEPTEMLPMHIHVKPKDSTPPTVGALLDDWLRSNRNPKPQLGKAPGAVA